VHIADSQHGQGRIRSSHGDKQLTRSLVTAWEACAGSTTAASKASSRPGEEHQGKQPHTLPILHQRKNTSVFATQTKNRTSSCTSSLKYIQQNHGGQLKLKTKPGGEGPGASPGGEGQASSRARRRRRQARSKLPSTASNRSCTQYHYCTTSGKR
jgi:hypothetical protein